MNGKTNFTPFLIGVLLVLALSFVFFVIPKSPKPIEPVTTVTQPKPLVHAENFVIPAMGTVSVTRRGRCRTDSTDSPLITSEKVDSKIVFTSFEPEDVFARIWFYDLRKYRTCHEEFKHLQTAGHIL